MKKNRRFWFFRIAAILIGILLIYRCDLLFPPDTDDSVATVKDIDGNEYTSVIIGTQEWMVENLKTTRYNDGTLITLKTNGYTSHSYCWYNNDISYRQIYGALYSWEVAKSGKLAPTGWHVPDYDDWLLFYHFLGENGGCKIMETGSAHWISPSNACATNETGFTALPAGYHSIYGGFVNMGTRTGWWPSTLRLAPLSYPNAYILSENGLSANETRPNEYFSVRCIKNTVPTVTTSAVTNLTSSAAFSGGEVTIKGGSESTNRGVCWDTSHNPTTLDSKTTDEFDIANWPMPGVWKLPTFKSTVTGLQPNTTYYLRAYATNSDGPGYGKEVTFKTLP